MPPYADSDRRAARIRFLRVAGLLLLSLFAFDLVDGSPPFAFEHARQGSTHGSGPGGAEKGDQSPDAEFFCARSIVVAPKQPADLGPPRDEHVDPLPEAGLARGFVASPFHPPRPFQS
ncbi:MAG: hypothetical protein LJF15_13055 [Acidobacteria bacterium]|jgi:hypothetical protein|nr:hypothetical protein [Acidobacteriota bacterium]